MTDRLDHVQDMKNLVSRFKVEFSSMYSAMSDLDAPLKNHQVSSPDMVDIGFFFREIMTLADDLRKEAKARSELAGKLICLDTIETGDTTTRGQYATGSSEGGVKPSLPRVGSPEHEQLCDLFGVAEGNREVVRFHWKTIKEQMEQAAQDGKDFPVIIPTTPDFKTVYRRRNNS